jgi:hypothetical protein
MTPKAYQNLQQPFANTLAKMLGFGTVNTGAPAQTGTGAPTQQFAGGSYPQAGGAQGGQRGNTGTFTNAVQIGPNGTQQPGHYVNQPLGGGRGGTTQQVWVPDGPASGSGQPIYTAGGAGGTGNPNDILSGIPTYQGPLTSQIGGNEQSILNQLMGPNADNGSNAFIQSLLNGSAYSGVGNVNPQQVAQNTGAINYGTDAQGNPLDPYSAMQLGQAQNPFLQAYTQAQQRTTMDQLTQALTRDLPSRFTAGGQFVQPQGSSAFDRAAALASNGAANAMGDIASNIGYNAYASDRALQANAINDQQNRELQAATGTAGNALTAAQGNQSTDLAAQTQNQNTGMAQVAGQQAGVGLQQAQIDTMIKNLQAQALPRLIQEQGIDRGVDAFNQQMNSLLQVLGITANVTQPTVANSSKSETKPNLIPSISV